MINHACSIDDHRQPYRWIELTNTLSEPHKSVLVKNYPDDSYTSIMESGSARNYNYDARAFVSMEGKIPNWGHLHLTWYKLAEYLLSPRYREFIRQITGISLDNLVMEANLYKYGWGHHMDAHTDMDTKVLTHVIYFNEDWNENDGGNLRILYSNNVYDVSRIVTPNIGNSVILIRSDNSWHCVENTNVEKTRRCMTVTFYKPGSKSPMWDLEGREYEYHFNKL